MLIKNEKFNLKNTTEKINNIKIIDNKTAKDMKDRYSW